MNSNGNGSALVPHTAPATPDRVGQSTAVEQSRAVAEVEAAIVVAMRHPRNVAAAIEAMRESCAQAALAERAFFRFPRGGQTVSGPSVHLARELARVWGNVQYGIAELRRDDEYGQSEMIAFAWDVQTNTRNSSAFIQPHMRDKRDGPERLTDMRDIYESNANAGARRVREAIFAVLPTWFVEEAKDLCSKTLADGGGKPLAQRTADAIAVFGKVGVTAGQLEAKIGLPSAKWTEHDIAQLSVIYRSLRNGEVSKDEEFPSERTTVADLLGPPQSPGAQPPAAAGAQASATPAEGGKTAVPAHPKPTRAGLGKLLARIPLGEPEDVGEFLGWRAGRAGACLLADLNPQEITAIDGYLEDVMLAAAGDTAAAAEAIWTEYRAAQESRQSPDGAQ